MQHDLITYWKTSSAEIIRVCKIYLGRIKPDCIERIEIERGVRAIEHRPRSELRRGETRYDHPR